MSALLPVWIAPTARAVPWAPLAGCAVMLGLVTALSAGSSAPASRASLVGVGSAALAGAVVAGWGDRAEALLAAMPVGRDRRRLHRLALLLPVVAATWVDFVVLQPPHLLLTDWPYDAALALLVTGLAVATWIDGPAGIAAGAATPLAWTFAATTAGDGDGPVADLATAWSTHPAGLLAASALLGLAGAVRRGRR